MPTYRKSEASADAAVASLPDGAELSNVRPLAEDLYDRDEIGPMYAAEHNAKTYHLFADEIEGL